MNRVDAAAAPEPDAFGPAVLHRGNAKLSPVIGLPSGAMYGVIERGKAVQHVRIDRDRRPKKLRKAARRAERARVAAQAQTAEGAS